MNVADAIARLDALPTDDPEVAHSAADDILLAVVPDEVRLAYEGVVARSSWWATA